MLNVLFILHLPPPVHGASMVGKYIHDSYRINNTFDCHYINLTTASGLDDIGRIGFAKVVRYIMLIQTIRREVRRMRPDLVYVTPNAAGGAFYKDYFIVQMLKHMGCKVVCHYHNKGVAVKQHKWFDNLLYRRFFHGVKVILLAEKLYSDLLKYVSKDNVAICPNGIPDCHNEINRTLKPAYSPLNILYLSNMIEEKGVWVLLNACRELNRRGITYECIFVGGWTDISEEAFIAKAVELGLKVATPGYPNNNAKIIALGPRYGEEKERCFTQADVFVFPTYYKKECFPLTLLEAMQNSLACISTDEAAIPDIIEDGITGLVVPKRDSLALANAIERLAADRRLCLEMGKNGRKRYEEHFTIDNFENNLCCILSSFILGAN